MDLEHEMERTRSQTVLVKTTSSSQPPALCFAPDTAEGRDESDLWSSIVPPTLSPSLLSDVRSSAVLLQLN